MFYCCLLVIKLFGVDVRCAKVRLGLGAPKVPQLSGVLMNLMPEDRWTKDDRC